MSFTEHLLDNDTFGIDANGWWWARCLCGHRIGPHGDKAGGYRCFDGPRIPYGSRKQVEGQTMTPEQIQRLQELVEKPEWSDTEQIRDLLPELLDDWKRMRSHLKAIEGTSLRRLDVSATWFGTLETIEDIARLGQL